MVARRPLSELSPAYAKRIQRAIDKGLISPEGKRQAARGHSTREYAQRKERKANPESGTSLTGQLSRSQKGQVTRHAAYMANYNPELLDDDDLADLKERLQEWVLSNGYRRFTELRQFQRDLVADYAQRRAQGTYFMHEGLLEGFARQFDIDDIRWFFYH